VAYPNITEHIQLMHVSFNIFFQNTYKIVQFDQRIPTGVNA